MADTKSNLDTKLAGVFAANKEHLDATPAVSELEARRKTLLENRRKLETLIVHYGGLLDELDTELDEVEDQLGIDNEDDEPKGKKDRMKHPQTKSRKGRLNLNARLNGSHS